MTATASRPPQSPLVAVLAAVCGGAVLDYYAGPLPWLPAVPATAVAAWLLRRSRIGAAACLLAFLAVGGAWHDLHWRRFPATDLGRYATEVPQPVALEAVVRAAPQQAPEPQHDPFRVIPAERTYRLPVRVTSLRDGGRWRPATGRTFAIVPGEAPRLRAGDRVRLFGRLVRIQAAANPGEFDARRHARRRRVLGYVRCNVAESVSKLSGGSPLNPQRWVDGAHDLFRRRLFARLPESQHALAAAMLLGDRYLLHEERRDELAETGLAHLIAVSGLHVGLAALFLGFTFRCVCGSRRAGLWATLVAAVAYAVLTGAQPPAMRAAVVICLGVVGELLGRRGISWNSLAAAGLVVFAFQPAAPLMVGPQLSFLAVGVLIALGSALRPKEQPQDPLDRLIVRTRPPHVKATRWATRSAGLTAVSTACIWTATAPLVAGSFRLIAPAGLVLGPLVVPPLLAAMYGGLALMIVPTSLAAGACSWGLSVIDGLVDLACAAGLGPLRTGGADAGRLLVCYACVLLALRIAGPGRRAAAAGLLAASLVVGLAPLPTPNRGELQVTFASVGHGLAVVIVAPDGRTLLYDAGAIADPRFTARKVAACLHDVGARRLDAVIVSHADADHYNALPRLLEWFPCRHAYLGTGFDRRDGAPAALREVLAEHGVPTQEVFAGDVLLDAGGCTIRVLHPSAEDGPWQSDNAGSVAAAIEYAGRRLLLLGDLEEEGLDRLLAGSPIDCDVALAPHHGSPTSAPPEFFAWASPETLVISGALSRTGDDTLTQFQSQARDVLHTAIDGAVTVVVDKEGRLDVASFLNAGS